MLFYVKQTISSEISAHKNPFWWKNRNIFIEKYKTILGGWFYVNVQVEKSESSSTAWFYFYDMNRFAKVTLLNPPKISSNRNVIFGLQNVEQTENLSTSPIRVCFPECWRIAWTFVWNGCNVPLCWVAEKQQQQQQQKSWINRQCFVNKKRSFHHWWSVHESRVFFLRSLVALTDQSVLNKIKDEKKKCKKAEFLYKKCYIEESGDFATRLHAVYVCIVDART